MPADLFSEAMRDLDLVVSVATVANDPVWFADHWFHPGTNEYWKRIAQGGLGGFRAHRREIVATLLDGTQAGERYELTDAELIVRGSLATYRIDLASRKLLKQIRGRTGTNR